MCRTSERFQHACRVLHQNALSADVLSRRGGGASPKGLAAPPTETHQKECAMGALTTHNYHDMHDPGSSGHLSTPQCSSADRQVLSTRVSTLLLRPVFPLISHSALRFDLARVGAFATAGTRPPPHTASLFMCNCNSFTSLLESLCMTVLFARLPHAPEGVHATINNPQQPHSFS